jgi:hypothetical protein
MNDLELEILAADLLIRRGRSREWVIFAICREHELQWNDVEPIVDHVLSTQAPQIGINYAGLRSIFLLAGIVIGGGLMITAGLEAIGLAEIAAPDAGLWELIQVTAAFIVGSVRLWGQLVLGCILFAFSLGRLLPYIARIVGP